MIRRPLLVLLIGITTWFLIAEVIVPAVHTPDGRVIVFWLAALVALVVSLVGGEALVVRYRPELGTGFFPETPTDVLAHREELDRQLDRADIAREPAPWSGGDAA